MTRREILTFLKEHKALLSAQYHIDKIGLFGSYARDEAKETSDIDLVIETSYKNFRNRHALIKFLEEKFHKPIDLGYLDSLHPFIRKEIEKEVIFV
jgi:predicted nucleotidyltransferase